MQWVSMEDYQELRRENEELKARIVELTKLVEEQAEIIRELREQLGKDSHNSSKPPSSDGYKKPAPKSLREKSGRRPGGQKGHSGSHLDITREADHVFDRYAPKCTACPHFERCKANAGVKEVRRKIDANVEVDITDYRAMSIRVCPLDGKEQCGTFPEGIKTAVQYGENLQALAVAMNTVGAVSVNRTHQILSGVFSIPISTGAISNFVSRFASAVLPVTEEIGRRMAGAKLGHFDETGTRVDGKLHWVHVASNREYTYLTLSSYRGQKGMAEANILSNFHGIAMHDCWSSYWCYEAMTHAVCCAHLLRELTGVKENHPDQAWAEDLIQLLLEMKKSKEAAIAGGADRLNDELLAGYNARYDKLIRDAVELNPVEEPQEKRRGRRKRGKLRALIDRLEKYKGAVCLFVHNFLAPFDNNQAERDFRMVKVKTKVSGCFRTNDGAKNYLTIMSYVGTAVKRGHSAFNAILKAVQGDASSILLAQGY